MAYQITAFAQLTHTTTRTLRYYHQLGLVVPTVAANGYRYYTSADADRLQRLLMLRELGFSLAAVRDLLDAQDPVLAKALRAQAQQLRTQQAALAQTQRRLQATLANLEGGTMMDDTKFKAFKDERLRQNDTRFGEEVVAKYGRAEKQAADQHFSRLSSADVQKMQAAEAQLKTALLAYLEAPTLTGAAAQAAFGAHRTWLQLATPTYSQAMHRGIAELYLADPRFAQYYTDLTGDERATAALAEIILRLAR